MSIDPLRVIGAITVVACPTLLFAGAVTGLVTFSNGTVADADQVNANFTAVADAVADNDARIDAATIATPFVCPSGQAVIGFDSVGGTVTPLCGDLEGRTACAAVLAADPSATSGVYEIDLDGAAGPLAPFDAYCEMSGGEAWTLCGSYGHQVRNNGFDYLYADWNDGDRVFSTDGNQVSGYGNFCGLMGELDSVYGRAFTNPSTARFTTAPVSIGDNPYDGTLANVRFAATGVAVGVWSKSSMSRGYYGGNGVTCAQNDNGQNQGSSICISNGSSYQMILGNINGNTSAHDWMCSPDAACGNSTTAVVQVFAR